MIISVHWPVSQPVQHYLVEFIDRLVMLSDLFYVPQLINHKHINRFDKDFNRHVKLVETSVLSKSHALWWILNFSKCHRRVKKNSTKNIGHWLSDYTQIN